MHTILAGLTCGAAVVFGVCCWHFARGRNVEVFRPAAKVALIVLVPVSCFNLWFGSHFGILVTSLQPMKISGAEAQWADCQKCAFSLFQIGGFTKSDEKPSFSIEIPGLLSYLSTGSFNGKVTGLKELNSQYVAKYGPGNYLPPIETVYWSMRGMAYAGSAVALVAILGAFLFWKRRLERLKWFLWLGVVATALPFIACAFGWMLTEIGRQPWIVQGLLKTADANSPAVSSTWLGISLAVFISLYAVLLVLDIWLMRRFAGRDPSDKGGAEAAPAIGY